MPNNYFSFKEFTVHQDACAMKVCTDACIQGAYTAQLIEDGTGDILDIGTGTGLLSLMVAQQTSANIIGIDIDEDAVAQASQNCKESKWNNNIQVLHSNLQSFSTTVLFDWIICNPPFYENDLHSPHISKNTAMHSTHLTFDNLLQKIEMLLSPQGKVSIMIPHIRLGYIEKLLPVYGFYLCKNLSVHQTKQHKCFRNILILSKQMVSPTNEILFINNETHYSESFIELLKPYYLHL